MAVELHSAKTEQSLLGLLISKPNLTRKVVGALSSDDFYFKDNAVVFQALVNTVEKLDTADETLILEELKKLSDKSNEQWAEYLSVLLLEKGIESNVDNYIDVIREKRQTRDLESTLKESVDMVGKGTTSVAELIGEVENKIFAVTKGRELNDFDGIEKLTQEFELKMQKMGQPGYDDGVRTTISTLDNQLGALKGGQFVIVAARPSMGKTAFALEIAKNVAKDKKVGFFSLEMPADQLITRMLSSESLIDSKNFVKAASQTQITNIRVTTALQTVKKLNLWIDDSPSLKIAELTWKARKLRDINEGLDLIVIDYLQLIESDSYNSDNRQQAISDISRQLKGLARELDIPVIALSQLSRRVESREDKRPQMSDIRESGAIEQDADIIMFLYREDYYKNKDDMDHNPNPLSTLEVIISKNRNGATGSLKLGIDLQHSKISVIHSTYNKE